MPFGNNAYFDNPLLNMGIGLLSQPTMGQGLLQGTQLARQAQSQGLQNKLQGQQISQGQAQQDFGGLLGRGMGNQPMPGMTGPPTQGQSEDDFKKQAIGLLAQFDPKAALSLLMPEKSDLTNNVKGYLEAKSLGLISPDATLEDFMKLGKGPLVNINNAPSGYTTTPDGNLAFIPGGPADPNIKPMTESQGLSNIYAKRAEEADQILNSLEGQYSPMGINTKQGAENMWVIGGAAGPIANKMLSPESQKAEQAQRNFVNAVLRKESGAVISQEEFDNASKQYFPQPGDSPEVIQQKAQNRRTQIEGLKAMGKTQEDTNSLLRPAQAFPTTQLFDQMDKDAGR